MNMMLRPLLLGGRRRHDSARALFRTCSSRCEWPGRCSKKRHFGDDAAGSSGGGEKGTGSDNALQGVGYAPGRPGQHKTPMVDYLWAMREKAEADRATTGETKVQGSEEPGKPVPPQETSIFYNFSEDASLVDSYGLTFFDTANPTGMVRVGRFMEDLDALAGNIALLHCKGGKNSAEGAIDDAKDLMLVTASIDRVELLHRANLADDIVLSGKVGWVGSSSLEIDMEACSSWTDEPWLSARFTFVGRSHSTGRAKKVRPLAPATEDDRVRFEEGEHRAAQRKAVREAKGAQGKSGISILSDQSLYDSLHQELPPLNASTKPDPKTKPMDIEQAVDLLFSDAMHRRLFPALGMAGCIALSETQLISTIMMHRQERNTAGRIFGGFLVRHAFEQAVSACYLLAGELLRFQEVDKVEFQAPVEVGDLVRFESSVLFVSTKLHARPSVHVEVVAIIITPTSSRISNRFFFTFLAPENATLPRVVPGSREEAFKIVHQYYRDIEQHRAGPLA